MTAAISCQNVSKTFRIPLDRSTTLKYRATHLRSSSRYHELHALEDVSFEVSQGEFLGIIGHNGSGKSTLLKVLSRIYRPDHGVVAINGKVSPFLELGVGFNPELTARENVYLNGAVLGLTRAELDRRIDGIIAFAELETFADQKLKNYSSGMQVRLAFSVAIQADAQILLMDEVLAVGDARFQEKCFDVFARYKREGKTVVLVTHDISAVNLYCDRVLLIDHGKLHADGGSGEVTALYRRMMGAVSEAEDSAAAVDAGDRWGTREVEITAMRLLDIDGGTHRVFSSGAPLIVEVDYAVHGAIDDFMCSLRVDRSDGLLLASPQATVGRLSMARQSPGTQGTLRYRVDALPLLAASYTLTIALNDQHGGHTYDQIERALSFRVIDERSRHGIFELGGSWVAEACTDSATQTPSAD
ncbi:MAG TPA: ABC transporter ATP-binding protein [Candidatus Dormibacteraeota bacterium]|nr:ABC transporter ATP-binding protein [Candidatus Dormibacteraeota bacterium]